MAVACSVAGGVLLSGCGSKDGVDSSVSQGENNIESSATVPSRIIFQTDLNGGGTMTLPRTQQIYSMSLTFYGYGFAANSRGWFESQNKGVNNSYSMMKISFSAKAGASFTIRYRSYGEKNYDYAIFGKLDQALSESLVADSTYFKRTYGESSPNDYYVTYSGISSGSHSIYVKYIKDGSQHSNDDTLQLFFESDGQYTNSYTSHWQFVGLMIGQLPTATRSGYVFDGWWTAKSGGTRITETTIYTAVATSGYQCLILFAHWVTTTATYPISFDYNYSGATVNLYNPSLVYDTQGCTYSSSTNRWTGSNISGNTFSYFKIQKWENGNFINESQRTSVGLLTFAFNKTTASANTRIGLNGSTIDRCLSIDLSSLQNGTYIISAYLYSYSESGGGSFGDIKIEKASTYSSYTEAARDVKAGSTYGTLPTPTRMGYKFNNWYRKKNYLNMDAMMDYLNKYQSDSNLKIQKDSDGTYSWCGGSADTGDGAQYRIFPVSLTVGGTYRLSYMARSSVEGEYYSTSLAPRRADNTDWYGNAYNDCYVIRDATWRWYETTFTVGNDFAGFSCGSWYGYERTYFKNIRLERIDIEDVETTVYSSSYQSFMAGHTLYARWSANTYTVSFSANGGSGSMSSRTFTYDTWYSISNSFSREGYTFSGWSISNATSDTHYYGSSISSYSTTSSTSWTHSITGTAYYKNLRSTSGTVTLSARWRANTYTVYYDPNGGTMPSIGGGCTGENCGCGTIGVCICKGCEVGNLCICCRSVETPVASKEVTFNSAYGTLATPTRANYTFAGWKRNVYVDPNQIFETTSNDFVWLRDVGVNLQAGRSYHLSFDLRLTSGMAEWEEDYLFVNYNTAPKLYTAGKTTLDNVTTTWQKYECDFTFAENGGLVNEIYERDILHIYLKGEVNKQIRNLVIMEDVETTSTTTMNLSYNHTLIAQWTPNVANVTVVLRLINKDGTGGETDTNAGGQVSISYTAVTGSTTTSSSVTQTAASDTYSAHANQNFVLTATANPGYAFVGFSTYSTPPAAISNPTTSRRSSQTYAPTKGFATYYVYFKQLSGNQLKYDEVDKYFYFEDGYYPQSRATNEGTLNSSASATGETINYNDGRSNVELPVYSYGSDRFVKVTKNGTSAWFKFEPIRWRISDYGVEKTERNIERYKTLLNFRNYTSYATNFTAVSDLILGVGAMHNTRSTVEGTSVTSMAGYQNVRDTLESCSISFGYAKSDNIIKVDSFSTYSQNNTVYTTDVAYTSPLRIASLSEIENVGFANKQARASDMVAFILGVDKNNASYWTRDLSNLGSGVAITASGTVVRPWLDQMLGTRFAYTFSEGSNAIS